MMPGPDQVVACPHCKGLGKYMTLRSGNTLGTCVWTDGKQVAPMLPSPPAVVRCRDCGKCYWLADADEVGTLDRWNDGEHQVDPSWVAAAEIQEPAEEEYYAAIAGGLAADPQQERDLRVLAWWRGNDAFRHGSGEQAGDTTASGARRNNLEALASVLHARDDNERIMKAEVLRELGEFASALALLRSVTSSEYDAVVRQLSSMCESKDMCVRELVFSA
jgi:hypothetical protein